jgi:hypothetical protein
LLVRDELAGWIGGFDRYTGRHGGDVAHWLSTYTGEDFLFDRKTSGTIYVPRAHVCIAGGIQPEILRRALGDEHFFNGLAARLLLVMPPRRRRRWSKAGLAPQLEAEFALLIERLRELQSETIEGEAEPVALRLDAAADGLWCDYFDRHNREQVLLNGPLASAWSKLEGGAARLALVIHLTKWAAEMPVSNTHIDESSMLAGIALAEWFKSETKRVYAALAEGDGEAELHALERFIQKCDGSVTVNDVTHGIRRYRNKTTEAREALNTLAERGRGRWVDPKPSPKGGKPTVRFELVPIVTVTDTATGDNAVGGIGDSDASDNSDVGVVE